MVDNEDGILEQVQGTVEDRRLRGDYQLGLEATLTAMFLRILEAKQESGASTDKLVDDIAALRRAMSEMVGTAQATSRLPGGSAAHAAAARVIGRHTNQLAHSLRLMGESTAAALEEITKVQQTQISAGERQLMDVLSGLLDRLAVVDELAASMKSIELRLEQLELATSQPQ